ncbi:MAG: MarR family winged helix-turn-helix transcriptional regulator, partial [Actinomycetota bacterium]
IIEFPVPRGFAGDKEAGLRKGVELADKDRRGDSATGSGEEEREGFERVLDAVAGIAEAWNERVARWLRENQVSFAQFRTILLLSKEGSQTLGELSERLSRARCTVTGLIDRLEAKGLVRRRRGRRDRRQVYVSLTEKGWELARELGEKVVPEISRLSERIMSRLTESEAVALAVALTKIREGLADNRRKSTRDGGNGVLALDQRGD